MGTVGGFTHERTREGGRNDWGTPPHIVHALGAFDLDPCGNPEQPLAANVLGDWGLMLPWVGRVWMNPPYGPRVGEWLDRLADHGNGIALVFARTETRAWASWVWGKADGILFLRGRVHFLNPSGAPVTNAAAPSALIAYGANNVDALRVSGLAGTLVTGWER